MRVYDLFHSLVEKFVPMDIPTKSELQNGAVNNYNKVFTEAKKINDEAATAIEFNKNLKEDEAPAVVPKLKIQHKLILQCEQWYMRYAFAVLFIYLVPKIKAYFNGEMSGGEMMEDEDDQGEWARFQSYKRFNSGM